MRIKEALDKARDMLNVANPLKEANILLSSHLKKSREWIFLHELDSLKKSDEFFKMVKRRADHEPLEYITKKASFYSRDFYVEEGVLIPRPETEILVDLVCAKLENIQNPKVLEVGVGSGIISIMLALLHKSVTINATDISIRALEVAYKNAVDFGVEKRIEFCQCSYEEDVVGDFDLLVSNPPYIADGTLLDKNVLHEPHLALFGGKRGHEMLEELVLIAKKRGIRYLCCEMGYDQRGVMEEVLVKNGVSEFVFYKDFSSLDRGFIAQF